MRVATRLRQFFRAVEFRDELAVQDEIPIVCQYLYLFLEYLLGDEPEWNDRWFDDVIGAQHKWKEPGRFQVAGQLVWGLITNPGPQWTDPFFADVVIAEGRRDAASYCIRFGRRDDLNKSELPYGFYPSSSVPSDTIDDPWNGEIDWKYEFRKDLSTEATVISS